jgi:hypothetical protein
VHVRTGSIIALIIVCFSFGTDGATAQAISTPAIDMAVIANNAFERVPGVVGVNEAAGNQNVQGNVSQIAIGRDSIPARWTQTTSTTDAVNGNASINDFAFAHVAGLVQINQSAGDGNAEGNVMIVRFAVPGNALNDATLASALPTQSATTHNPGANGLANTASTAASALRGHGVVQLNQVSGTGNASANGFLLQVGQTHP